MIRHAGRAAALFAIGALFAGGAWAQGVTLAQSVDNPYVVAEELMSSGGGTILLSSAPREETEGSAQRPAVQLLLPTANSIPMGNTAEITYTLTGATFAQDVGSGLIQATSDANSAVLSSLAAEVVAGGAIDDDSVTFMVEAVGTEGVAGGTNITFWVPNLAVMPASIGMMGDASVMGVAIVARVVEKRAVSMGTTGVPFPMVSGALDTPMVGETAAVNNLANRQVVALEDVIGISMADGGMATVNLDNRKMIADGGVSYMAPMADAATMALRVGTLDQTVPDDADTSMAFTLDPSKKAFYITTDDVEMLHESLMGSITVMVKGDYFLDGDMFVYGPRGGPYKEAETMNGVAMVSIPINNTGTTQDFLYVPGGVDDLRPGMFRAVATDPFDMAMMYMGEAAEIDYTGLEVQAYAQGVVSANAMDGRSILRVRCVDDTNDCSVFLGCRDQMGENYFGEAPMVSRLHTAVWNSQAISDVLNPGWPEGLGACDLYSNRNLEVQHMVRSGHVLVNNSKVVGRDDSVDNSGEFAEINAAIEDICNSIQGHVGREESGTPGMTDYFAAIDATPCNSVLGRSQIVNHGIGPTFIQTYDGDPNEPGNQGVN